MRRALLACLLLAGCPDTGVDPCDEDGDGWYKPTQECGGGDDCDDDDPSVNPDEPERCNGEDDNCDGRAVMCHEDNGGALRWGTEEEMGELVCADWPEIEPAGYCQPFED